MTLLVDAGALLAVDRGDREVHVRIDAERLSGRPAVVHGGIIGQVWRSPVGRQARLAVILRGLEIVPLDERLGKQAGLLLGLAGRHDVIDAALVCLARDGDQILTSDADDLRVLAEVAELHVDVIPV